jgi:hypothetical protein
MNFLVGIAGTGDAMVQMLPKIKAHSAKIG